MPKEFATEVLICGAGAAGLTLAIELARRDVAFRLIDKLDGPFHGSRGKGIQPRTQEILEDLGLIDRLFAAGGIYPPQREHRAEGAMDSASMDTGSETPFEPFRAPLMVPQFLTEAVMRERLLELGSAPQFGRELAGFEQGADGIEARIVGLGGEETIRARYLVGADGGRSFVRPALGIDFPGRTLGVRAVVADVALTGLPRDAWHRFNPGPPDQQISLCPLAGTDLFQLQAPIPLEVEVDLSAKGLEAMTRERTGRDDIAIHSVSWASAYAMNERLADRFRAGAVFLVGDAAHIHPPTGGQGLNTSLQDAYNLGWKLAAVLRGAPEALLDSYEAERRPVAVEMLGLAARLLDAAKQGEMRRGREVHQLDLGYRGSPLALEVPPRTGGLRAGDRAPDAPVRGAAGQGRRLFDLFAGVHWTLLGQAGDGGPQIRPGLHIHRFGPGGDLNDDNGCFDEAYGLSQGEWVLVRPDGYVGAVFGAGEGEALERHLDAMGLAA